MINKHKIYGPHEREFMEAPQKCVKAYSKSKDYTCLPDNVRDNIVVNNIAYSEFNYTYGGIEDDNLDYIKGVKFKKKINKNELHK